MATTALQARDLEREMRDEVWAAFSELLSYQRLPGADGAPRDVEPNEFALQRVAVDVGIATFRHRETGHCLSVILGERQQLVIPAGAQFGAPTECPATAVPA